jgi:hypothetical protein
MEPVYAAGDNKFNTTALENRLKVLQKTEH